MKTTVKTFLSFLAIALLFIGVHVHAEVYSVKKPDQYVSGKNDPEIPAECIPQYPWPPAYGASCSNVENVVDNSGEEDWANPEGGNNSKEVKPTTCSDHETCTGNCTESEVCLEYGVKPDTNPPQKVCEKSVKVQNCKCVPKCTIADPINYPFCCSVADKKGYECIKTCTMPNGDKVDIKENKPRCKKFEHCCYGQSNNGRKSPDPVDTEIGDPRDQCRMKCQDVCNDKFFVTRQPLPAPFQQCCTPPTPLKVGCFCCRTKANYLSPYCERFRAFFTCKEALPLDCSKDPAFNAPACNPKGSITPSATGYDPNYDPFVEFDGRFAYCGTPNSNLSCQYICRGSGVMLESEAPTTGIWANIPGNMDSEKYENNTIKYVQGNCTKTEEEELKVAWPPKEIIKKETCSGD